MEVGALNVYPRRCPTAIRLADHSSVAYLFAAALGCLETGPEPKAAAKTQRAKERKRAGRGWIQSHTSASRRWRASRLRRCYGAHAVADSTADTRLDIDRNNWRVSTGPVNP